MSEAIHKRRGERPCARPSDWARVHCGARFARLLLAWSLCAMAAAEGPQFGDSGANRESTSQPANSADDLWSSVEPQHLAEKAIATKPDETRIVRRKAPASEAHPASTAREAPSTGSWIRTTASLFAVIAVIGFASWGARTLSAGRFALSGRMRRHGVIEILSRTPLNPRQTLCLVRVGRRMVLVGVGADRVNTLDVITDADEVAQLAGADFFRGGQVTSKAFQKGLEAEATRYDADRPASSAAQSPAEAVLAGARQRLSDAVGRVRSRSQSA